MTLSAFKLEASNPKIARVIETKVATWRVGLSMRLIGVKLEFRGYQERGITSHNDNAIDN